MCLLPKCQGGHRPGRARAAVRSARHPADRGAHCGILAACPRADGAPWAEEETMNAVIRSLFLAGAVASPLFAEALPSDVSSNSEGQAEGLSLEQAYDQVIDTDQGLRIGLTQIREARLQPWSALSQMGPRLTGNASYFDPQEQRSTSTGPVL